MPPPPVRVNIAQNVHRRFLVSVLHDEPATDDDISGTTKLSVTLSMNPFAKAPGRTGTHHSSPLAGLT